MRNPGRISHKTGYSREERAFPKIPYMQGVYLHTKDVREAIKKKGLVLTAHYLSQV
jgi:hypothetical protein